MADENGRDRLRTVDKNSEYGAIEPVWWAGLEASIRDFRTALFQPMSLGRTFLYLLTAQVLTAVRSWSCSGVQSVAANGQYIYEPSVARRILSYEIWNFDAGSSVDLRIESPEGGSNPIRIPANTYYTSDINLNPQTRFTILNSTVAPISVQVKVNGL